MTVNVHALILMSFVVCVGGIEFTSPTSIAGTRISSTLFSVYIGRQSSVSGISGNVTFHQWTHICSVRALDRAQFEGKIVFAHADSKDCDPDEMLADLESLGALGVVFVHGSPFTQPGFAHHFRFADKVSPRSSIPLLSVYEGDLPYTTLQDTITTHGHATVSLSYSSSDFHTLHSSSTYTIVWRLVLPILFGLLALLSATYLIQYLLFRSKDSVQGLRLELAKQDGSSPIQRTARAQFASSPPTTPHNSSLSLNPYSPARMSRERANSLTNSSEKVPPRRSSSFRSQGSGMSTSPIQLLVQLSAALPEGLTPIQKSPSQQQLDEIEAAKHLIEDYHRQKSHSHDILANGEQSPPITPDQPRADSPTPPLTKDTAAEKAMSVSSSEYSSEYSDSELPPSPPTRPKIPALGMGLSLPTTTLQSGALDSKPRANTVFGLNLAAMQVPINEQTPRGAAGIDYISEAKELVERLQREKAASMMVQGSPSLLAGDEESENRNGHFEPAIAGRSTEDALEDENGCESEVRDLERPYSGSDVSKNRSTLKLEKRRQTVDVDEKVRRSSVFDMKAVSVASSPVHASLPAALVSRRSDQSLGRTQAVASDARSENVSTATAQSFALSRALSRTASQGGFQEFRTSSAITHTDPGHILVSTPSHASLNGISAEHHSRQTPFVTTPPSPSGTASSLTPPTHNAIPTHTRSSVRIVPSTPALRAVAVCGLVWQMLVAAACAVWFAVDPPFSTNGVLNFEDTGIVTMYGAFLVAASTFPGYTAAYLLRDAVVTASRSSRTCLPPALVVTVLLQLIWLAVPSALGFTLWSGWDSLDLLHALLWAAFLLTLCPPIAMAVIIRSAPSSSVLFRYGSAVRTWGVCCGVSQLLIVPVALLHWDFSLIASTIALGSFALSCLVATACRVKFFASLL